MIAMRGCRRLRGLNKPRNLFAPNFHWQPVYFTDVNGEAGRPSPLNKLHFGLLAHP